MPDITPSHVTKDILSLLDLLKVNLLALAEQRGLTQVQLHSLYILSQHPELAMRQIADALHCDASNVTGIVDRLVGQGLVTRQEAAHDRRIKALRLTAKGHEVIQSIKDNLPAHLGCDRLSVQERQQLHEVIQKLISS